MASPIIHTFFRAIQRIDPSVKEYRITDRISYELSEWTQEGGHRRLVSGDLASLNVIGMAMAEKNRGLFTVGGGCGPNRPANFTGRTVDDDVIQQAMRDIAEENAEKFKLKPVVAYRGGPKEYFEPEEERAPE